MHSWFELAHPGSGAAAGGGSPSVTDWLSAAGTCVGALGTAGTLIWVVWEFLASRGAKERQQHRATARGITAWYVGESPAGGDCLRSDIALLNRSGEPVYNLVVSLVMIQGSGPQTGTEAPPDCRTVLSLLPPGRFWTSVQGGWNGMDRRAGVEIAFVDPGGASWLRGADGRLRELPVTPFEHYRLARPLDLAIPRSTRTARVGDDA